MNAFTKLIILAVLGLLTSCVQPSYNRTVVFELDAKAVKDIKTVGIRGNDKPLNWENDYPMQFDPKDSLYKATVTGKTGYLFTEFKFVVNGDFELKERDNRKVYFKNQDTIVYKATFDKLP
ncbi:MAG: hypothetical protein CFE23_02540 [Flavobacterium sp. BFFFF1]|uniref:hypothetical protein n=1 Tax=Flavobacterium sp. BFFFF1 TaxID=2015557 RepID=UPI000BD819E9|nr:hypothetical protein [Flavobacterium sp. BFFFF1]OYU81781.1 MAG: hypothetical protein CFE23_02540 [Flavobacterium sp. BFFFF1]